MFTHVDGFEAFQSSLTGYCQFKRQGLPVDAIPQYRSGLRLSTVNERGILNNYAPKVAVYYAEYPTVGEQRWYMFQGAIAILFIGCLVLTTIAVS
jgi:hypothetical protein